MEAFEVLYQSDNAVTLRGASTINLATGQREYLDGTATVTFRVQTSDRQDLAGYPWPEPMSYIAASQGDYLGVLRDTIPWVVDRTYWLVVTGDAGPDQHRVWSIPLRVVQREEDR